MEKWHVVALLICCGYWQWKYLFVPATLVKVGWLDYVGFGMWAIAMPLLYLAL